MSDNSTRASTFVSKVRDNTLKYLQELNEDNAMLRHKNEILECDKRILESSMAALQCEVEMERAEHEKLATTIETLEQLRASSAEEYAIVEEENNNLASLYSATYSLHGTLDHAQVLAVIKEIVANLIGSEEMAIFECEEESRLRLVASEGLEDANLHEVSSDAGIIGWTVRAGRTYFAGDEHVDVQAADYETNLTACIPLAIGELKIGAVAVFRLLPQKQNGIQQVDHELFDLLGSQAAMAMYSAKLHAKLGSPARD